MAESEKNNSTPAAYDIRGGTIDYGKDYEVKICSLLTLRSACHKIVSNNWTMMNADRCGAFDDLVLSIETTDGRNLTYLIQLKHGMESNAIPARDFKTKKNGSYYLEKYYHTIAEIKAAIDDETDANSEVINHLRHYREEIVFILFTNRGTTDCDFLKNVSKNSKHAKEWLLYQFLDTGGSIALFNYTKLELKTAEDVRNWMENRFFLFYEQMHVDKTDAAIAAEIENLLRPVKITKRKLTEIVQKFNIFVTDSCRGELGGHYPLTRNLAFRILFEHSIEPYMVKFEEPTDSAAHSLSIWNEMIKDKPVIVSDEDDVVLQFLNGFLNDNIRIYRDDPINVNLWKRHPEKIRKQILRSVGRAKQIRYADFYEYLWKNGEVPLVLRANDPQDFKDILHLIKVFGHNYPVLVLTSDVSQLTGAKLPNLLFSLNDLNDKIRKKILNLPVKLQGRSGITLRDFVLADALHLLNVKNVIYILTNKYNIGNKCESLPNFFVERSLEKVWLDFEVLEKIPCEMFLIKCTSLQHFQSVLSKHGLSIDYSKIAVWQKKIADEVRIIIFEDGGSLKQMETFGVTRNVAAHILVVHDNNIEWIKSFGSIKNIREFRVNSGIQSYVNGNQMLEGISNKVIIIGACPGMGKSTIMDYLAFKAPTDWWVIKIKLLDYVDYYKSSSFEEAHLEPSKHLIYFANNQNPNDDLAKIVFQKYLLLKKVVLILDAFDEVPVSSQKHAMNMIKSICDSNYCTFITTRPIYQPQLEDLVNTFSVGIKMFSKLDQKTYLSNYFQQIDSASDAPVVHSFVNLLLEAAKENLNDHDQEFTGIPLQTKLLAEVFADDYKRFTKTKEFENRRFDLLYLYQHFIDQKVRIFCSKFGDSSEDLLFQYKSYRTLYALKLLFPSKDLEELKIEEKLDQVFQLFPNTLQMMQKDGIVVAENTFVHRTFAEYLAAEWLADNVTTEFIHLVRYLMQKMFDPSFTVVRSIFDRILAKNCPLILAVIGHRRQDAQNIIKSNRDIVNNRDRGGRLVFHLIGAWGAQHPINYKTDKEISKLKQTISADVPYEILHLLGRHGLDSKDGLLGYTPLDYAVASGALHIADYICSRLPYISADSLYKEDRLDYTYDYMVKMNYSSLLPIMTRHRILSHLNSVFSLQGTIAQQIGANYLRRLAVSGSIENLSILINNETNIDEVDFIGCTVLHAAVMYGRIIMTNLLLAKGANPNITDGNGCTPLHWATIKGFPNLVNILLLNKAEVDLTCKKGRTPLHVASIVAEFKNRNEIVAVLLNNGANIAAKDADKKTPFHYCVEYKQIEILKLLLESTGCSSSILSEVISSKDGSNIALMHNIVRLDFVDALLLFLPLNPDLEVKEVHERTILHIAADEGRTEIVKLLLSHGANIEALDISNMTALHMAAWNGHRNTVEVLLANGATVEVKDVFNRTPLMCAVHNGHEEIANILLEKGANLETTAERDRTPLIASARSGHTSMVKLLLQKGANINAVNDERMSALHFAAFAGHEDVVNLLLSKGAAFDKRDIYGRSSLICAAISGCTNSADLLLRQGVNMEIKDNEEISALNWAAFRGHKDTVNLLLQQGADFETREKFNSTPLFCAACNGHADIVAALVVKGADVEAKCQEGATALFVASSNGRTSVVEYLLSAGAEVDATNIVGNTPLMVAVRNGHIDVVNLLLTSNANIEAIDLENMTALHWGAWNGHIDIVRLLLNKSANLNCENVYKTYPLLSAAVHGHATTVELLLSNGANIETVDDEKFTALHCAASNGHTETVSLLISKGADIKAKNAEDSTPLHLAAFDNHSATLSELLQSGADVNATDKRKMTSLHWAILKSDLLTAELLLAAGADLEAKGEDGKTPLLSVCSQGNKEAVAFLLNRGANIEARDDGNRSALHLAVGEQYGDVAKFLLCCGADVEARDTFGDTPLMYAARLNYAQMVILLRNSKLDGTNNDLETALHWAVFNGHGAVVEMLISQGANMDVKDNCGRTPLIYAACNGDNDMVNLLLVRGANIETENLEGRTALHWAVSKCMTSTVELLLLKEAPLEAKDKNGKSALLWAIIESNLEMVQLLLLKGADLKTTDKDGLGVLHWACSGGNTTILEFLIQKLPNLETMDVYARTPLFYAAQQGHVHLVKLLLSNGASIKAKDIEDKTPLHVAAINGCLGVVKAILDFNSEESNEIDTNNIVNTKDKFGQTPLVCASSSSHCDIIHALIVHGADVKTVDYESKTALHWAGFHDHSNVVELLLQHGANLEAVDKEGKTVLMCVAEQGYIKTAATLVASGANLERENNAGKTALVWALENHHADVVAFLLANGAQMKESTTQSKCCVM